MEPKPLTPDRLQTIIAAEAALLIGLIVRDNATLGSLRSNASRGGDADHWQCFIDKNFPTAGAAEHIVPYVAGIDDHNDHRLRSVHYTAAAQDNHEVAAILFCKDRTCHNGGAKEIRLHPVKDNRLYPSLIQLPQNPVESSGSLHGFSTRNDDHGLFSRHRLIMKFVQHSSTEQCISRL